jgi:uncharacterized protein (TIGR02594 family)
VPEPASPPPPAPETVIPQPRPAAPETAEQTTPEEPRRSANRQRATRNQVERNSRNRRREHSGPVETASARSTPSGLGSYALVSEARRYIGTNPTSMARLWCARFMNFVLHRTGYRGTGSDAALSFRRYGQRVRGPRIGAIAVMRRKGGGHVGIVSGIDRHGNPILISGNTTIGNGRRIVAERVYPRTRIISYVMPGR